MTCRNHDSSDAWISWSRYTEIPPSTRTRLISAMTSRVVPAGKVIAEAQRPDFDVGPDAAGVDETAGSIRLGAFDLEHKVLRPATP